MKLKILGFSEYVIYPETPDKFYHIKIELISSTNEKHEDEISVNRDKDGYFHWIKSGDVVEKVDLNSDCKLSNCILKYCYEKIK